LRDQLKIDDELEDAKIKLVACRDFYLKSAFEAIDVPYKLNNFVKSHDLPVTQEDLQGLNICGYDSFVKLVLPENKDFAEMVLNRQADRDINERQNSFIKALNDKSPVFKGTQVSLRCASAPDVMRLLAVTLSLIVLNKYRNKEIRSQF